MASGSNFAQVIRKIQKTVDLSSKQALNKAAVSTRAKLAKEVSAALGVASGTVKSRTLLIPATTQNPGVTISIGTKVNLPASAFKVSKVKLTSSRGTRVGTTYDIKTQGKQIAPAGVIITGKNSGKKVVVTNLGNRKYTTVRVDGFSEAVQAQLGQLRTYFLDTFKKIFSSQIDFNIKNK